MTGSELFRVRLDEALAEVKREIGMRQTFYPERVRDRKMNRIDADRQLGRMEAAAMFLNELKGLKGGNYEGNGGR